MIRVLDGGISTTVQDLGRFGQYHIGMPPSGAMDLFSHRVANALVGNSPEAATLEMTYGGADLRFEEDAVVALAGADMPARIDGDDVPMHEAVRVERGQELETEFTTTGARTYLAVVGGIDVPEVMGSKSTYTLVGIGGHEGRTLADGDELAIGENGVDREAVIGNRAPESRLRDFEAIDDVRVVVGLCDYRLTDESRERLCEVDWKVTPEADRVGYRLEGPELDFVEREQPFGAGTDPSNVVDVGYPIGSIQLPQQPIVLMRDAVTGGGYATVATVISTDRDLLAQIRTHETVRFDAVTVDEALEAREAAQADLDAIRDALE
ncbi:biotin-dependent carboxyltransferase family protein [Halosolutus halophilus]|uniref:5-oxoprolinase subunit C family protein n=1 Tax=Halosolutus halophilus TaxID=1552990 RepID=UPI00223526CD|nr:biotin-dependent carboxyltransferase family protein [Halosolutus halophilus]